MRFLAGNVEPAVAAARPTAKACHACDGDTAAGFAHAYLDGDACKLDKLYVHPVQQRRGLAAALLAAIAAWAAAQPVGRLRLQVNRGNTQALHVYAKYGFAIDESRVFDLGNGFVMDDHIMERPL